MYWKKILKTDEIDYTRLNVNNIKSEEYRHLFLLLYWPIYGVIFVLLERVPVTDSYFLMYSPIDRLIPFEEIFVIPYVLWYGYMAFPLVYAILYDIKAFRKTMIFIIISFSISLLIFAIYPSCQNLRPEVFLRDNFLTKLMKSLYDIDTNTNCFPSLHVVGSMGILYFSLAVKRKKTFLWVASFFILTNLINISTLFVKQHSFVDVVSGVVLSIIVIGGMELYYCRKDKTDKKIKSKNQNNATYEIKANN